MQEVVLSASLVPLARCIFFVLSSLDLDCRFEAEHTWGQGRLKLYWGPGQHRF
uniref:Uncharacterized protein n=1 Tax=Kalanchoe fedtschenkoi TaxID=63787 RepID=A0A7N1A958_KALFE